MVDRNGWTLETVRQYLTARLDALQFIVEERESRNVERFDAAKERVMVAMQSAEKAIMKAEAATDKRFDGVNEHRGALSDQATRLMPRLEYQVQHQALIEKLEMVTLRVTKAESTSEGSGVSRNLVFQIISMVASLGALTGLIFVIARGH